MGKWWRREEEEKEEEATAVAAAGGGGDDGGSLRYWLLRRAAGIDPGAAAEDGREKDERAEESLSSPRRSRDVLEGDGRSERKRLGLRLCLGTGASAETSCAARTDHSKWQRLSHTGAALPAMRKRALPARTKRSGPRGGTECFAPGRKAQR